MAIRLADRMARISYEIRDIAARAKKVQATGKKIHWFNIGDPNKFGFKPPKHITDAILQALSEPKYSGYCPSEGDPELRAAIAAQEGVQPDNVTIHSGLSEGIDFLIQALVDPGDNVLLPSPSYPLYVTKLSAVGGEPNYYPTDENFMPDTEAIRKGINKKTRALVCISPNNPTGATYPRKLMKEIADIAGEHKLLLISDEIYSRTTLDSESSTTMREVAGDIQFVSGNGLSKNFIYTGARVGYLALHGEGMDNLREALIKLCNQRLSTNWEMQRGALAAFTMPLSHLEPMKAELRKRRDIVYRGLNSIPGMRCAKPTAAFYSFPEIKTGKFASDREFAYALLEETGVLVVPGSAFSPVLPGKFFRLVFLAQPEELHEALSKLESFVRKRC